MTTISTRKDCERVSSCARLVEMGARPILAAEVTGVGRHSAIRMYRKIRKQGPPRGMLPSSVEWFFVNRVRRLHASALAVVYCSMSPGAGYAHKLVESYVAYVGLYGARAAIDVNRWILLSRMIDEGSVKITSCTDCDIRFVISEYEFMTGGACPDCKRMCR